VKAPGTTLVIFAAVALVQLGVPASMLVRRERTLATGEVYRFKTQPVDPYDAFRGRYVALGFQVNEIDLPADHGFRRRQRAHAVLGAGDDGFAVIERLEHKRPAEGVSMPVRVRYVNGGKVNLRLPFDRYYLEESLAPEAEAAYRRHSSRTKQDAYVTVRVRSGFAVLEELYVADKPILRFLADGEDAAEVGGLEP
jgi:uncharacterized membrane-anchored protein